ncbi:peptidoglycan-binding protein [Streptomyces sp. NPDC046977]|uniref:peptidoglycan-binding protein n=1 Tax=Streptomyces sp. NPDC046977 TaxID=3154703 RepID=UPI0033F46439
MTTRTGPQRYPGADQTHRYQDDYPGDPMEVNAVVLHTTEGRTLPDYEGGATAPNLTAKPDCKAQKLGWYQHFDIDISSRALENRPGGVQTNTLNVVQVELVGTCDPETRNRWIKAGDKQNEDFVFWPEAPEWALRELAKFLAWAHTEHDVPLTGPSLWLPYPKSYGATSARMSFPQWNAFEGICGHQHAAENSHGDPGAINFAKLLGYARALVGTPVSGTPTKPPVKKPPAKPKYEPFPGAGWFTVGRKSPIVTAMRKRLVAVGCNKYKSTANQDVIGSGDIASYEAWQRACGYTGADAKWPPGKATWDRLRVPNV